MKYGLLALALVIGLGLYQGWFARLHDHLTTSALTDDARLAVEVRCGGETGRSADECRSTLKRLYLAGSLDPDKTLRTYCDSVKHGRWGGSLPPPPKLCVQRYGGWKPG